MDYPLDVFTVDADAVHFVLGGAMIVPNAQHNLTVQPEPNAAFFWWKAAPGIVDLVVAWVQQRTTESSR